MNVLTPRIHGVLDYVTVVFFLLAPTLFPASAGQVAALCYLLAVVHLTMTLLTDFPLGMAEVIPFGVHGVVELVVAIALVVAPWILSDLFFGAQWFFTLVGVAIFVVWVLSDYSAPRASSKTSAKARPTASATSGPTGTGTATTDAAKTDTPRARTTEAKTSEGTTADDATGGSSREETADGDGSSASASRSAQNS